MRYLLVFFALASTAPALSAPLDEPPAVLREIAPAERQPGTLVVVTASNDKEDMGDGARIICRKIEVTGSRMNTKKVCATATEWATQKAQNRQVIEQAQNKKWNAEN